MTAAEGRLIARSFITAVAGIIALYGILAGAYAIAHGETGKGIGGIAIAGICALVAYGAYEWEQRSRVSGVTSGIHLAVLRDDVLSEMSDEDVRLLQSILDDEARREARRNMKR